MLLGKDSDSDADMIDFDAKGNRASASVAGAEEAGSGKQTLEAGINAYVDAIRGRDAAKRGQRGRLKFRNRPREGKDDDDGGEDVGKPARDPLATLRGHGRGNKMQSQRRPLGTAKTRGGRVTKRGFSGRRR